MFFESCQDWVGKEEGTGAEPLALREGVASPVTLSLDEIKGSSWTSLCSFSIRFKDGTSPLQ